ncbi:MAG: PIG-L family deacetylase [Chloroflexota bacterium]
MMHVFLSPHYDDAVYSCGGTIHQLVQRGEDVLIITVMGGYPPDPLPDTPIVRDLHQRWAAGENPIDEREQEDYAAAAILGTGTTHMSIADCVYRTSAEGTPLYPDENSLWHNIHPDDPALLRLQNALNASAGVTFYVPLGAGGHVDHLIVRNWALNVARRGEAGRLLFYEDLPYNEDPEAVRRATEQMPPTKTHTVLLTEPDIAAKIEGVRAYRSQISTFWQDERMLAARVRAALQRGNHAPAEYYRELTGTATPSESD